MQGISVTVPIETFREIMTVEEGENTVEARVVLGFNDGTTKQITPIRVMVKRLATLFGVDEMPADQTADFEAHGVDMRIELPIPRPESIVPEAVSH
jgi:hypothetical protein